MSHLLKVMITRAKESSVLVLIELSKCKKHFQRPFVIVRGAYDKFPDFFRMGTFIDSTHMKL